MASGKQTARRSATQARYRATVERILDSAAALIAEKGPEAVTMTEIARRADVVIGALYQYFADKSAITRALLSRHHAQVRQLLQGYLSDIRSFRDFMAAIEAAAAKYYELHQTDRFCIGIWGAVQTDAQLQRLDLEDTLENARTLFAISRPFLPGVAGDELMATCALLIEFATITGRFARLMPSGLKRQMLPIYRRIMRGSLDALYAANEQSGRQPNPMRRRRA